MTRFFLYFLVLSFSITNLFSAAAPKVIATVPIVVGLNPAAVAVTPDNKYAYVANNNNNTITGQDTVSVIDLSKNKVVQTILDPHFNQPYTITINKAGTKAYVTNSFTTTVSVIDIATNTVVATINGFNGPSGFAITPDGNFAYVNNYGAGSSSGMGTTVNVVDLNMNVIVGSAITVDQAPASLAITPDGKFVYVINYVDGNPGTGTTNVIRTSDNTVVATITGFSGPFNIAITPDGRFAYVTNFGSNNFSPVGTTVSVIDLNSNTIVATITVGRQPGGIAITPDGRFAYVCNYNTLYLGPSFTQLTAGQGSVNVIDIATNTLLPPLIIVGASPAGIAISSNGAYAYVANYTSNNVSVLLLERMWLR